MNTKHEHAKIKQSRAKILKQVERLNEMVRKHNNYVVLVEALAEEQRINSNLVREFDAAERLRHACITRYCCMRVKPSDVM